LYVHFENKNVLADAVLDYNLEMVAKQVKAVIDQYDNPKDKLFAYIDAFRNPFKPVVEGGCPMMNFGTEADDQDEMMREKVGLMVNKTQQLIVDIAADGIRKGIFKKNWDYNGFATIMFGLIEGGVLICRTTRKLDKMGVINRYLKKLIDEQLI